MKLLKLNWKLFSTALALCLFVFMSSCSSDDDDTSQQNVGSISAERFNKLPAPSQEDFELAFNEIAQKRPNLLTGNADTLSLALFELLETKYKDKKSEYLESDVRLSGDEWRLCVEECKEAYKIHKAFMFAMLYAKSNFPGAPVLLADASKMNAFFFAYWAATMANSSSSEFAYKMIKAHITQYKKTQTVNVHSHNANVGITLMEKYPSAKILDLKDLLLESQYMYIDAQSIEGDIICLVFSTGKEKYDTVMKGTLTNPDSNLVWDATFYIYEYNKIVRGYYAISAGQAMQRRRFSGTVTEKGLSIDISYPYVFEASPSPCQNMQAVLLGSELALKGNWTSSSCRKGGVIDVKVVAE